MLALPNFDLDSGQATKANEYSLADDSYAKLLARLSGGQFSLTTELRDNILAFYSAPAAPINTKKNPGTWQNVLIELDQLKSTKPVSGAADGAQP